jgi:hypothetical protein
MEDHPIVRKMLKDKPHKCDECGITSLHNFVSFDDIVTQKQFDETTEEGKYVKKRMNLCTLCYEINIVQHNLERIKTYIRRRVNGKQDI